MKSPDRITELVNRQAALRAELKNINTELGRLRTRMRNDLKAAKMAMRITKADADRLRKLEVLKRYGYATEL